MLSMILFSSLEDLTKLAEVRTLVESVSDPGWMNMPVQLNNMVPSTDNHTFNHQLWSNLMMWRKGHKKHIITNE